MSAVVDILNTLNTYDSTEAQYVNSLTDIEIGITGNDIIDINICHMNIRSIQKNFEEILIMLQSTKQTIHVLVLTETWQLKSQSNIQIPQYVCHYNNANFNQNDGTIIYVHNSLSVQNINNVKLNEVTFTILNIKSKNKMYKIIATYRPPSTNPEIFIDNIKNIIKSHKSNEVEIFVGDINLDLMDKNNVLVELYINVLCEKGFYPQITSPTRVSENSSTCIDHIFLKNQKHTKLSSISYILKCTITDHYATLLYLIEKNNVDKKQNATHVYEKINYEKIIRDLKNENWSEVYNENNVDSATNKFIAKYKFISKKYTKIITYKRTNEQKIKPWISRGIINSIQNRDKLKDKLLKQPNNTEIKNKYTKYRNMINKLIRKTKSEYYKVKFNEVNSDVKKVWALIKEATNEKTKHDKTIINQIQTENKVLTEPREIACAYNTYFTEIGHKMANEIINNNNKEDNFGENIAVNIKNSIFLYPVSENEIQNSINSLKSNNTPGDDGIHAKT